MRKFMKQHLLKVLPILMVLVIPSWRPLQATPFAVPESYKMQVCQPGSPMLQSDVCWGQVYNPGPSMMMNLNYNPQGQAPMSMNLMYDPYRQNPMAMPLGGPGMGAGMGPQNPGMMGPGGMSYEEQMLMQYMWEQQRIQQMMAMQGSGGGMYPPGFQQVGQNWMTPIGGIHNGGPTFGGGLGFNNRIFPPPSQFMPGQPNFPGPPNLNYPYGMQGMPQ